jgi:phosphatidylserine/phosphatidylglycerophosphate/cardiolipin synthase-like enzyme
MANVTAMEPQVLVDLLALNLEHCQLVALPQDQRTITVVSPWLTDMELALHPSGHHASLGLKGSAQSLQLSEALRWFCRQGWQLNLAVLRYGDSYCGLKKDPAHFQREVSVLRSLLLAGARIFLCPGLHAKGIVTPLGVVTGTTNYTHSGLHLQMQNAYYFPYNHSEFAKTRTQLLSFLQPQWRTSEIP